MIHVHHVGVASPGAQTASYLSFVGAFVIRTAQYVYVKCTHKDLATNSR